MSKKRINKARSIIYIFIISGLLSLTSIVILLVWNNTISPKLEIAELTFLEAVGIVAFVYVIYFGINFGSAECQDDTKDVIMADKKMANDKMSYADELIQNDLLKNVPESERQDLKEFIARCCGIKSKQEKSENSLRVNIDSTEK